MKLFLAALLVCNLGALTKAERERHGALTKQLHASATPVELKDGYALVLKDLSLRDAAEWIAYESRCCPFLDFALEVPAKGPMRLRLSGDPEVKKFLKAELGL